MFLLVGESTRLYNYWTEIAPENSLIFHLGEQFHHHAWNGLRFWDLIQPFFMFIVGVAMVFSVSKRTKYPAKRKKITTHIVKRCIILFFFGVILHCGYKQALVWELWNVLTQLSVTILIAYLIIELPIKIQLLISIGLIILTELLYRFSGIEGFDQPFVKGENFGSFMDMVLMGKINSGGWVAINCIPTAAHTIWGVLAGKVLQSDKIPDQKMKTLVLFGIAALILGYFLDFSGFTPIIKRICTSSFVLASGGWCLVALALCYWLIDIKGWKKFVWIFSIVGMNSIFIYMFCETAGHQWLNGFVEIFTGGFLQFLGAGESIQKLLTAFSTLAIEWYLCYWLFTRKIFFKI